MTLDVALSVLQEGLALSWSHMAGEHCPRTSGKSFACCVDAGGHHDCMLCMQCCSASFEVEMFHLLGWWVD